MYISQKCQYAIRAILELAKRYGHPPVRSGEVAELQAIPPRFLENILGELKAGGLVESHRGSQGGFQLTVPPEELLVGQIVRMIEGPLDPVRCTGDMHSVNCPLKNRCSLIDLWSEAKKAVENVYDSVTFEDLVNREKELERRCCVDFCI